MHVWAEPAKDKIAQVKTPWTDIPKTLHWEGNIKGEAVEMTVTADAFVKEDHKLTKDENGIVIAVDGSKVSDFFKEDQKIIPPHIKSWTVRWGGKELKLNKALYTSIFKPRLDGPEPSFEAADLNDKVWIGPSEDGTELLITMVSGYDAVTSLIAFTLDKDGKMRRFKLAVRS